MSVKINIHPVLHHFTDDQDIVKVDGNTVGECLGELVARFPQIEKGLFGKNGKLLNYVEIYINGQSAYPDELAKPVKDRDEIHIIIMLAGG